jgi:hypothetical protein
MSKRPSLAETMRLAAVAPEPVQVPLQPAQLPAPPGRESGFYAATRVGKKKVTAALPPADHKRLRQLALERDATTEALLTEAIGDLFAKYGKTGAGQGKGAL